MKTKRIYQGLRIIIVLGWIAFFVYNLYMIRFLGQEYQRDPSNFVFFDNAQDREAYKTTIPYGNSDWIKETSLVGQCKPMIYFNDLYFNKIAPFIKLAGLLVLLTLISRIRPGEWISLGKKIEKFSEKLEDDDELDKKA